MATPSSIHAQRIPWTEVPSQLQSIGLQRVGHTQAQVGHKWEAAQHTLIAALYIVALLRRSVLYVGDFI